MRNAALWILLASAAPAFAQSPPPDTTPPAQITDLTATGPDHGHFLHLKWTAPEGDDGSTAGNGATKYRIFYSQDGPVTSTAAAEATEDVPLPSSPGAGQEMVLNSGLAYKTTYFVAILAVDEAGNEGTISNSPSARTGAKCDGGGATSSARGIAPVWAALVGLAVLAVLSR